MLAFGELEQARMRSIFRSNIKVFRQPRMVCTAGLVAS